MLIAVNVSERLFVVSHVINWLPVQSLPCPLYVSSVDSGWMNEGHIPLALGLNAARQHLCLMS